MVFATSSRYSFKSSGITIFTPSKKSIINPEKILRSETDTDNNLDGIFGLDGELTLDTTLKRDETEKKHKEKAVFQEEVETMLL